MPRSFVTLYHQSCLPAVEVDSLLHSARVLRQPGKTFEPARRCSSLPIALAIGAVKQSTLEVQFNANTRT